MAHLLKYDIGARPAQHDVETTDDGIAVDGKEIKILAERDPGALPWGDLGVDVVIESTGFFTKAADARKHVDQGGAKKVIISAPASGEDLTDRAGRQRLDVRRVPDGHLQRVLHHQLPGPAGQGPARRVRHRARPDDDRSTPTPRTRTCRTPRTRTCAGPAPRRINVIPTSTGAAKAIGLVLPELKGKLDGYALRVPVPTGSCTDLTVTLSRETTVEEVNAAYAAAADGPLKGYLRYTEDPIVSSDIVTDPASCIFDAGLTKVIGDQVKVVGWYDNEWGYSNRLVDLVTLVGSRLS